MIHSKEFYGSAENLSELETGFGRSVELSFEEGMALNPTRLLTDWASKNTGTSDMVNAEEAMAIGEKMGVKLKNAPSSISREAAMMLAERQYQSEKRQEYLQSGPSGLKGFGASLAGNVGASFLDPIGLAVNFIPFVGQAKYASILAKTGSSFAGRFAARAAVGAIEGAAGNALIEPLVYGAATNLNENYSLADSAMSVGAGAIMGASLHSMFGLPEDIRTHINAKREKSLPSMPTETTENPFPKEQGLTEKDLAAAQQLDERSKYQRDLEARQQKEFLEYQRMVENSDADRTSYKDGNELAVAAAAQAANGNNIDVGPVRNIQDANRTVRFDEARKLDPIAFKILDQTQDQALALDEFKAILNRQYDSSAPVQTAERINEILTKLDQSEKLELTAKQVLDLQEELSALRGYEGSKDFLKDLYKLDSLEKQIAFIDQEKARVALKPEIHQRISDAYRNAGKNLELNPKSGVVKAKKTDAYLESFVEGRSEMPTIRRDADPGFDVDVARETKAHLDNFTDPKKHELYDSKAIEQTDLEYADLKTKENAAPEDLFKESMDDLEILAAQYGMKASDIIDSGLLKEMQEFPEMVDALKNLIPCVAGIK